MVPLKSMHGIIEQISSKIIDLTLILGLSTKIFRA